MGQRIGILHDIDCMGPMAFVGMFQNGNGGALFDRCGDKKEYDYLSKKIFLWRSKCAKAGTRRNKKKVPLKLIANNHWYHAVQLKDIWLRKLMMSLGLYLKEIERRPGSSFFGNVGQ